jgi:LPS O-antigen subunit length determinant protein (WzzB/FepE family)
VLAAKKRQTLKPAISEDEADFVDILISLWDGKLVIIGITFLSLLGVSIAYDVLPNLYTITIEIRSAPESNFVQFRSLNQTLNQNNLPFQIESKNVLRNFKEEVRDQEEILVAIATNEYFKNIQKK